MFFYLNIACELIRVSEKLGVFYFRSHVVVLVEKIHEN